MQFGTGRTVNGLRESSGIYSRTTKRDTQEVKKKKQTISCFFHENHIDSIKLNTRDKHRRNRRFRMKHKSLMKIKHRKSLTQHLF